MASSSRSGRCERLDGEPTPAPAPPVAEEERSAGAARGEGIAIAVVATAALLAGGFAVIPPFGLLRDPVSPTKVFALVAIALTAVAAPFAIAEGWSDRRFRKARAQLEAQGGWAGIAPYDGGLGRGLLFSSDTRRLLLLEPRGGVGAPRVVEEVIVETAPGVSTVAERQPPLGPPP